MKKLLLLALVFGAVFYGWKRNAQRDLMNISNPVYVQIHMQMDARGRNFKQYFYAEAIDIADCEAYAKKVISDLTKKDSGGGWEITASECKPQLEPSLMLMFENKPASLTYLSLASGAKNEREERLMYWGLSLEESDRICNGLTAKYQGRQGLVKCIQALR